MTCAVFRGGTPSMAVPPTQNTAPVLEFNCLYTHDIRRKQKRWKDGFLRYHTFNKRIMVYDVSRNFIGDSHWKSEYDLQDGDEVTLEKGGVLVQVAESVGRTETDLTELRQSAKKKSSEKGSSSPVRAVRPTAMRPTNSRDAANLAQLKHRSLNALLGGTKGSIGKAAFPAQSPFEQRHTDVENQQWSDGRPAKRQRTDRADFAHTRNNFAPQGRAPNQTSPSVAPDFRPPNRKAALHGPNQQHARKVPVIDLRSDTMDNDRFLNGFSDDAFMPLSSPTKKTVDLSNKRPVRSSSPAFQRQTTPERARQQALLTDDQSESGLVPEKRSNGTRSVHGQDLQAPITRKDSPQRDQIRQDLVDINAQPIQKQVPVPNEDRIIEILADEAGSRARPERSPSVRPRTANADKTLRLSATAPKKRTLLCQEQASKRPTRNHSANTERAIGALLDATSQDAPADRGTKNNQRQQLRERLAKIDDRTRRKPDGTSPNPHGGAQKPARYAETTNVKTTTRENVQEAGIAEVAQLDELITAINQQQPTDFVTPPAPEPRELRRVVSEANAILSSRSKRAPGAPVRLTPSALKKSILHPRAKGPAVQKALTEKSGNALPPRSRGTKLKDRAVSLNITSNGTSTVLLARPFQAPKDLKPPTPDRIPDPWSREAFDLFTWRPPEWDEENWCQRMNENELTT